MEFKEAHSVAEVFDCLEEKTLIVLDLDNTLIESSTHFGSYQWAAFLIKQWLAETGKTLKEALNRFVPVWEKTQYQIKMQLVEAKSPQWINQLKEEGHVIVGLTGRSSYLVDQTIAELDRNQLIFSEPSFKDANFVKNFDKAAYSKGTLFVGPYGHKGFVLAQFIEELKDSFNKIIFVDDQTRYLKQVEEALKPTKIDFLGVHFVALREKVESFDYSLSLEEEKRLKSQSEKALRDTFVS
ncbi:MAG: hypothetical protein S4CHLAM7_08120 [Chlamydiae bacterium]|nr:hypothetical protein [Chlamydiota bacterium]